MKKVPAEKLCEAYRKACIKYLTRYGLLNYHFTFKVEMLTDAAAQVGYDVGAVRTAQFSINEDAQLGDVDILAKHEVLELLLGDLATMASVSCSDNHVNCALHKVIFSLMNAEDSNDRMPRG